MPNNDFILGCGDNNLLKYFSTLLPSLHEAEMQIREPRLMQGVQNPKWGASFDV